MTGASAEISGLDQAQLASLIREHRELADRQAITDCLLRYCRGVDRHDNALAISAYHADARDDHGAFIGSARGVIEWADALHRAAFTTHHHYVTNSTIDLDGDTAHVETYYIFSAVPHGSSGAVLGGGRYLDRFERRDGRWGIADRICTVEWGLDESLDAIRQLSEQSSWSQSDPSYMRPLQTARPDRDTTADAPQ